MLTKTQGGVGTVAGGATAGAIVGSYIMPGVGTLVGAAVGSAVGGIAGSLGIGKSAKKAAKKATWIQQEREQNAEDAYYLQLIREARMARSGSLAASTTYGLATSSLASSALSSIGSQSQYSVQYTANDQRLVNLYNFYMKKAGKYAKAAQTTLATGQIASMAFGVGAAFASAGAAAGSAGLDAAGVTVGATEITPAMTTPMSEEAALTAFNSTYSTAYADALASNLFKVGMWNTVAAPIYSGVSRYNQI